MHAPADDVNSGSNCPNCGHHLNRDSKFCSACGQKTGSPRISLKGLISDFFDSVFNLNSRFFVTVARLFIPGYLTREFFIGRQVRYMSPLRLFFVTLIGMYAVLGVTFVNQLESQIEADASYQDYQISRDAKHLVTTAAYQMGYDSMGTHEQRLLDSLIRTIELAAVDTSDGLQLSLRRDSVVILSPEDVFEIELDSLYRKYQLTTFWERLMTRQLVRAQREPAQVTRFIIANTSWMILLLMPALALCMKLLYFRRYVVEHLVFLFHFHAAVFVTCIVGVPFIKYLPDVILLAVPLALFAFLYLAMLRYYQRGWGATLLRLLLLCVSYVTVLAVFISLTALISLIIFH